MADQQPPQQAGTPAGMQWDPARDGYRPPVTLLVQLQVLIALGIASAHGKPMNDSYYDDTARAWHLSWKW
eukprot:8799600-Heterocapsa_arctica.AAC.1